jgi:hypothetical protein
MMRENELHLCNFYFGTSLIQIYQDATWFMSGVKNFVGSRCLCKLRACAMYAAPVKTSKY